MQECNVDCSCKRAEEDVSFRGIAGAAHGRGILVSLSDAGQMSEPAVSINFCSENGCENAVPNAATDEHVKRLDKKYVPSKKHARGGWGTIMNLDDETAQEVIRHGVRVGKRLYCKRAETYYVFNDDNVGGYHGYQIAFDKVPNEARKGLE